jgi:type I restriction enzyme M protein
MSNVSGIIKSIQDIMRKDVGVDGDAQRISQLVWLFFLKIVDDREEELELTEDNYLSPLPEELRWRNWAKDTEGITGDELLDFVNLKLFPTLKNKLKIEGEHGGRALVIKNVFEDAYNYMKSGTLLRQVVNKICEINFNASGDRHTFGSIYEQILKDLQSAGNAGEFYTPRAVTTFIVNRVAPKLDETVLDPACGTGGFLTNVIEYKREHFVKSPADEEILQKSILGVEKKALPHMLCTTNMILHGIDVPINIRHDNTLSRPLRDYTNADRVNVVVTNPPFGGMEEDGIENNFPANFRTRETADLFLNLIMHILKNEGRAAVVLPDGFLFGEGIKTRIKEKLLAECNLHTLVRLPNGVFNPYTGIKTNILFFTKGKPTEQVWYYEHPYPEGVVNYNKTKPMRFEEFQSEIAWWGNEENGFKTRVETEQAWKVSLDEIKERNYNLDIKNPHVADQISHDPDELLAQYNKEQSEITNLRNQLKSILAEALSKGGEN